MVSARSSDSFQTRKPMSPRRRDVFPTESMSGWSRDSKWRTMGRGSQAGKEAGGG